MNEPLLKVEKLNLTYDDSHGRLPVLRDISFLVEEREFICLVGPSGCGKSTLLRLVAGLDRPTSGQIRLAGKAVDAQAPSRDVGFVFQDPTLMAWRTVKANVMLPLEITVTASKTLIGKHRNCWSSSALPGSREPTRLNSPAAWPSEWPWRAPWCTSRRYCFWMSPSVLWMR